MRMLLMIMSLLAAEAFATSYKVKLEANLKQNNTTQSTIKTAIVEMDKKWIVPIDKENKLKIEMMITKPTKNDPKVKYPELSLQFEGKIYKKEAKKLVLVSKVKIITLINQEAILTIKNDDQSEVEVKMTASE